MAVAASGVSGVIVHGLADDEYGAVFDSAEKVSKWKRCRLISSADPNVAEMVASGLLQLERRRGAVLDLDRVDSCCRSTVDPPRRPGDVGEHVQRVHRLAQEHTTELGLLPASPRFP